MVLRVSLSVIKDLVKSLSIEAYQELCTAVEIGRWADGTALSDKQKQESLQLVLAWQAVNSEDPEHMQIGSDGEIVMKSKAVLKRQFRESGVEEIDIKQLKP